jgi:hypothetical protein
VGPIHAEHTFHAKINAMSNSTGSNDPLNPAYGQNPGLVQPERPKSGIGTKANIAVLILVVVVAAMLYWWRDKPATDTPPPAATEIK